MSETVTIRRATLRILLTWALRAGAEDGLYSVRRSVAEARDILSEADAKS